MHRCMAMHRLYKWLAESPPARQLQMAAYERGFEAIAVERGNVIAKGNGKTGDAALVNCAVDLMNKLDKPAGAAMPL